MIDVLVFRSCYFSGYIYPWYCALFIELWNELKQIYSLRPELLFILGSVKVKLYKLWLSVQDKI
jgi:hypothetical protein